MESCSDGVAYLQIFDALFPGKVPLQRCNFGAKTENEKKKNLRLLGSVFESLGVNRIVPVAELSRGQFQDNFEFLTWCYSFVQRTCPTANLQYQGFERRLAAQGHQRGKEAKGSGHEKGGVSRRSGLAMDLVSL